MSDQTRDQELKLVAPQHVIIEFKSGEIKAYDLPSWGEANKVAMAMVLPGSNRFSQFTIGKKEAPHHDGTVIINLDEVVRIEIKRLVES